jgi:hypothetical protein
MSITIHDQGGSVVVRGDGDGLDVWNALRRHYVARYPSALGTGGLRYPETTNRDVRAVIAILTRTLGLLDARIAGYDDEARRWATVAKRANAAMRGNDDGATFVDNATFWTRDTRRLAVYLAVARHLPSQDELLGDLAALAANAPGGVS